MKLKICGLKYTDNIKDVAKFTPDYMGFIFYQDSKRFVGEEFDPVFLNSLDLKIKKVGVFVNSTKDHILKNVKKYQLDFVQLHGDETSGYCNELCHDVKIIKAFGVDETFDFSQLQDFKTSASYFLFDTKTSEYGGSGEQFDWNILEKYDNEIPFFLSGGIDLENIEKILHLKNINIHAIDANSKFEIEQGLKDIRKIKLLKNAIHR